MAEGKDRVLERLIPLMESRNWQTVEAELSELCFAKLAPHERESWSYLRGISAYRQGNPSEALFRFYAAACQHPNNGEIAFSFGQQLITSGLDVSGFQIWKRIRFPDVPASFVMAQARYAYLCDRQQVGIGYLTPVWKHVLSHGISDPTFLVTRGLPMFETLWSALGALHEEMKALDTFRAMTIEAAKHLKDLDGDMYLAFLDAVEGRGLEHYAEILLSHRKDGYAYGQKDLQLAVLRSQRAPNLDAALALLQGVDLCFPPKGEPMRPEYDFPWLDDVRNLAIASAMRRFGETDIEKHYQDAFLNVQKLLMEPEHAFDFRLVEYQSTLKDFVTSSWKRPDGITDKRWMDYVSISARE